jgi:hypothetical protein
MRTDSEIINSGFESIFSKLGMVDAERFIILIKRDKFDYTEWQKKLWPDESLESLSAQAQKGLGAVLIELWGFGSQVRQALCPFFKAFYVIKSPKDTRYLPVRY